jgi:hypothetical protein
MNDFSRLASFNGGIIDKMRLSGQGEVESVV